MEENAVLAPVYSVPKHERTIGALRQRWLHGRLSTDSYVAALRRVAAYYSADADLLTSRARGLHCTAANLERRAR